NPDQWFKGPAAPFFGVAWQATDKLTLKAEYSSDGYDAEVDAGEIDLQSLVNFGLDYKVGAATRLAAYYMHGSEVGLQLSFDLNPRRSAAPSGYETAPLPVLIRPSRASDPGAYATDWVSDPAVHPGIQTALAETLAKD